MVIAADTGSPLRRAIIRLTARELREGRTTLTDSEGRYEVVELPAGRYTVSASKAGYVTLQYGQRYASEQGRPLELADGQSLDRVSLALPRGGVITGRIVDEFGDPITDASVMALRYQFTRGKHRLVPVQRGSQTDDIGQYRIFGLPPGDYVVSAFLRNRGLNDAEAASTGYAPTYFPGTSSPGDAQSIRVLPAQETGADFQLFPARLVRVQGTVVSSSGQPVAGGMVRLVGAAELGPAVMGGSTARIGGDGRFTISSVAPGNYTLIAAAGQGRGREDANGVESARVPLTVGGDDTSSLVVTTTAGTVATGRIVIEGGLPSFSPSALRVQVTPADPDEGTFFGGRNSRVSEDWSFELGNLFGRALLSVTGLPRGTWRLKSVLVGGQDVTDSGVDATDRPRIEDVEIVITSQATELSGAVTDSRGRPVGDCVIVVFAEDETLWTHPLGRYTLTSRPDQDGRYLLSNLPPGDYLAAAVDYLDMSGGLDPELLAQLRGVSLPLRVGSGEKKAVDLKLAVQQ